MAFFLNKTTIGARFSSHFQGSCDDAFAHSSRQFHITPGPREQALLAEDPALKRFKSHKKSVKLVKKAGNVLTVVVAAGCFYEIYVRAMTREEAQK